MLPLLPAGCNAIVSATNSHRNKETKPIDPTPLTTQKNKAEKSHSNKGGQV